MNIVAFSSLITTHKTSWRMYPNIQPCDFNEREYASLLGIVPELMSLKSI